MRTAWRSTDDDTPAGRTGAPGPAPGRTPDTEHSGVRPGYAGHLGALAAGPSARPRERPFGFTGPAVRPTARFGGGSGDAPQAPTGGPTLTLTTGTATEPAAGASGVPAPAASPEAAGDPRVGWSSTAPVPVLRHRRDGILPAVAAALSCRGLTLTATAGRADRAPELHPLVEDFLSTLTSDRRERFTGRCAETILISRRIAGADEARSKRAARKPMTTGEARKALKHAKLTTRRIREDGDPLHGAFAPPCRSCTALAAHFGVHVVDPSPDQS
ncbi:YwqJ-related putative deaminase [Streptomyces sp. NPDC058374]|uniref:YwqJ-related putative deaminase n=1 Tax=unclassified Streptomyces TaxID=2593676 RepID=UPI003646349E